MSVILVTGGRDYADAAKVREVLERVNPGLIIEGGATGADKLCRIWGEDHGVHVVRVNALWKAYYSAAGPKRNAVMVEIARRLGARVVAFPGGSGTADCLRRARAAGLTVEVVS